MKRICSNCKKPIKQVHRWRNVHHRFLWFRWTTLAHRDCALPEQGPAAKGERQLPFPVEVIPASSTAQFWTSPDAPRDELARLD